MKTMERCRIKKPERKCTGLQTQCINTFIILRNLGCRSKRDYCIKNGRDFTGWKRLIFFYIARMKNLKASQEFMIFAYIVVFIAQFFTFGYSSYYYTTHGGGFTLFNEAKVEQSGWDYHAWWAVIIIMGVVM
jgi:hypothetical protein